MKQILHFLLTLITYTLFDLAFLNFFAKKFIEKEVSHLLAEKADLIAGIIFYFIFIFTLIHFVVMPAWKSQNNTKLLLDAALFGLATYSTYELVNKALLKDWSIKLVLVDISWGVLVSMLVAYVSFQILSLLRFPA